MGLVPFSDNVTVRKRVQSTKVQKNKLGKAPLTFMEDHMNIFGLEHLVVGVKHFKYFLRKCEQ